MSNIELLKKLNEFYIYANQGLYIDKVYNKNKYMIAYSEKVPDTECNYVTNLDVKSQEDFKQIIKNAKSEMDSLKRNACYKISPLDGKLYKDREKYFAPKDFKETDNEVWQIFEDFNSLDNVGKFTDFNVELEKTNDMKQFAHMTYDCFNAVDEEDPYAAMNKGYINIYENFKEHPDSKYKHEFYYIKSNNEIVGVITLVFGDGICGIYGLGIAKKHRKKGIGKEALRKLINQCRHKNVDMAFLQTEEGFYPADMYRKIGFKDACHVYFYEANN